MTRTAFNPNQINNKPGAVRVNGGNKGKLQNQDEEKGNEQIIQYKRLQDSYLSVYFLAMFSNWLQGPYIYRVYRDKGWSDDSIAYLYIMKYATNCMFGLIVGHLADRCGRKLLCTTYSVLFIMCCITKLSSNYFVLLCGKMLGGISTAILYSVFEAWYLNEHINFYQFPSDWLNVTLSKATLYSGVSAILAGLTAQILVECFDLSPTFASLMAVPFLLITFLKIQKWKEHSPLKESLDNNNNGKSTDFYKLINLIFNKDKKLLLLGVIQCFTETVMYVFIFSWTPILKNVAGLPLGLVFTSFMVALMAGSHFYKFLILKKLRAQNLLTFSAILASISFIMVERCLKYAQSYEAEQDAMKIVKLVCYISFILYEFSLGLYYPSIGFLRGQIVPEEYRATFVNCFRVPMNIITCICLVHTDKQNNSKTQNKSQVLISVSSVLLIVTILLSKFFSKKYDTFKTTQTKKLG